MQAVRYLAGVSILLALSGCGGGGGGGGNDKATPPPSAPEPNAKAHEMINAEKPLRSTNIIIAVADSGTNTNHEEFEGTSIDARSGAFSYESWYDTGTGTYKNELFTFDGDDHFPDYEVGAISDDVAHGTQVASLIFGKSRGLLTDGTLLVFDVGYVGQVSQGTFNPKGRRPSTRAAVLAATEKSSAHKIDFMNLSMRDADTYLTPENDDGLERDMFRKIKDRDIGVIASAGNLSINLSEIYASDAPDCEENWRESEEYGTPNYNRCYYLESSRYRLKFIPYDDDILRNNFISVIAVKNNKQPAEFSNIPGTEPKIQERFISAPGVLLDTATIRDGEINTGYTSSTGTSFAAPLVTAAAGAVKSKFTSLSSAAVLQILLDTANKDFDGYDPKQHGMGILDVEAALNVNPNDYIGL